MKYKYSGNCQDRRKAHRKAMRLSQSISKQHEIEIAKPKKSLWGKIKGFFKD